MAAECAVDGCCDLLSLGNSSSQEQAHELACVVISDIGAGQRRARRPMLGPYDSTFPLPVGVGAVGGGGGATVDEPKPNPDVTPGGSTPGFQTGMGDGATVAEPKPKPDVTPASRYPGSQIGLGEGDTVPEPG